MKITKLQRHTAYIIMLIEIDDIEFFCHCMMLFDLPINENSIRYHFPELYEYKPLKNWEGTSQWFNDYEDGRGKRKRILKKCIQETY